MYKACSSRDKFIKSMECPNLDGAVDILEITVIFKSNF
jgi:hypothetical protein